MDRRVFLRGLAFGILGMPRVGPAQPARKVHRIGVLQSTALIPDIVGPQPKTSTVAALLRGLQELGHVYGEHFVTEARSGEGKPERYPSEAAELVSRRVDVIVASGPVLPALKQATSTIPVVMAAAGDPLRQGFVQSLGRPGGNFTGLSLQLVETAVKRLELLKELVPGAAPVAVLRADNDGLHSWQAAESAAKKRGWKVMSLVIRDGSQIEAAFKEATRAGAGGLLVLPIGLLDPHAQRIADLAAKSRLPAMYGLRSYVEAGGLVSYSADIVDIWRRAAVFVDRILKGAPPADLPVEQPTKFDLVINLKAARSIGLTIPPQFLSRVDTVLQ
jgi:putative ABC transport system substrate-binding protein